MRVTFALSYEKMTRNINRKQEDIDRLSTAFATGKRLQAQHDDPLAWSRVMGLKQDLREFEAFQANINFARGWNEVTENALNQLTDALTDAKNIAIDAVDGLTDRDIHVQAVNGIMKQIEGLAATAYRDRFIFNGLWPTDPSAAEPPFTLQVNTTTGDVEDVTHNLYSGGSFTPESLQRVEVRVGKNRSLPQTVSTTAREVFYDDSDAGDPPSNILNCLLDLKTALANGDTAAIQTALGTLDNFQMQLSKVSATVGSRLATLETQNNALANLKIEHQSLISDTEEADMAELITQLSMKQTALEVGLRVTSMLNELNLLNFL